MDVGAEGLKVNLGNSEVLILIFLCILSKFCGYFVTTAQITKRFCVNKYYRCVIKSIETTIVVIFSPIYPYTPYFGGKICAMVCAH